VHSEYFLKQVKRNTGEKELIYVNQAMISKIIDVIRDMVVS
jgi:hypothetical protein